MKTSVAIIAVVVFLALDLVFYYLIIRRMDRPSPSAAFARGRGFSVMPDSEGEPVGLMLRQRLPLGRGELSDIVRLPIPGCDGYLFTTLPQADSHLPKTSENRRQFIAVLLENPLDGGLLIHPAIRLPFSGFKQRRLFRVFKAGTYLPVSVARLIPELAESYRARVELEKTDLAKVFSAEMAGVLTRAPRKRGFALWAGPGGFLLYINPLLTTGEEAAKFYDFATELARAISGPGH